MMAASQKLVDLGYEVFLPHCFHTKDLVDYLIDGVKTFEIGCVSLDQSESFAKQNNCILVNCQLSLGPSSNKTDFWGDMYGEEYKFSIIEKKLNCGIKYEDKFNFKWKRNLNKEQILMQLLNIKDDEDFDLCHLTRDSYSKGVFPVAPNKRVIEINRINGFSLLDWYSIILKAKRIFTVQSSVQCFIDAIKSHLNHDELYLLNDPSEHDRQVVPAKKWKFNFFDKKRVVFFDMNGNVVQMKTIIE